jgi:hypothetical protein
MCVCVCVCVWTVGMNMYERLTRFMGEIPLTIILSLDL